MSSLPVDARDTHSADGWTRGALVVWFTLGVVASAYLLGAHTAGLPLPTREDPRLLDAIASRRRERPLVLHVLSADCECSARVLARLVLRTARDDVDERLVLVGEGPLEALRAEVTAAGFDAEAVPPAELPARFGMEVAPVLVVTDRLGDVAYVGGYTDRKQSERVQTDVLIDSALRGERPTALPVLGCAVTSSMRASVDPWGLR